ncbi:MAG: PBP1A family penicillin-binding protein [Alcaligenaceae bacterium]|nr:PBP1A family penicillin-binding protein [Alcaligenaceae bacterium]
MSKTTASKKEKSSSGSWLGRFIMKSIVFCAGIGLCGALLAAMAIGLTWPNLPDLNAMTDYRPRIPLRIYSEDKVLLAEYGEERRNVLRFNEIPDSMKLAVLAAEDDNFYNHNGVDWSGVGRAVLANLTSGAKSQGASTITMQVARNFYLSSEKSFIRKFYELLLTYKIEDRLSKDQILELYLNQIYLGHRAYGFSAAARTYFGIPLSQISIAQSAMLAGIPKAPSRFNPKANLKRATERQHYILGRMLKLGYINQQQHDAAINEKMVIKSRDPESPDTQFARHGQYVAELARQLMYNIYQDNVYGRGLNVYTTVHSKDQQQAYHAVRDGILNYTRRKPYPGPVDQLELPAGIEQDTEKMADFLDSVKNKYPDSDDMLIHLVLSASPNKVVAIREAGQAIELTGTELNNAKRALVAKPSSKRHIQRGSVIYLQKVKGEWTIINMPEVEGVFVAMNPETGAIEAMIGGFDFNRGDFNRATQAWRQPGSIFKPFVYAAGLERGLTPETNISDQPFYLSAAKTGSKPWTPKNYGNSYTYSLTMRQALYKSKNMVSIRILEAVGPDFAMEFISRFGFNPARHPPKGAYLTMALGAGSVTPLQMASAFSVFANGGYRVNPYIIDHVTDPEGRVLMKAQPAKAGDEANRVLDPRTAYVMDDMLRGVARNGTAAKAQALLKRSDIGGKTGTTNQSFDAWFAGYTPKLVGVSWLGFDQPRSLGDRETGGGAAMPIWLDYMSKALPSVPVVKQGPLPAGLAKVGNNFFYSEFPQGQAIANLGVGGSGYAPGTEAGSAKPATGSGSGDAIGKLIESFNPLGGPPIRF